MARMTAREIDQAFAEDLTEQQLEMEHDMEMDLRFEEPDHDQVIEENPYDQSMDRDFEYDYDYSYEPYPMWED